MTASTSALVPSGIVSFDVGAGLEQRARGLDVAGAHGEQERRERAAFERSRDVGARRR